MIWLLLLLAASGHYDRAREAFARRQLAEARREINAALAENPDLVPALLLRGRLAMAENQMEGARTDLQRAAQLAPKSADAQFLFGFVLYLDNDFRSAIPALERARALNPRDARAYLYLALAHEGLAETDAALPLYEKALALDSNVDTLVAYGRLLFTLGRFEESSKKIEAALKLDAQSRDAHYEMGRLHFEAGRYAEAAAEGERAFALPGFGTTDRQIHYLLARAYSKLGKQDLAAKHLEAFNKSPASLRR